MNTNLQMLNVVTMTSREIAELTDKRHSDVLRDIDRLVKSLNAELRAGYKSSTYLSGDPPREYRQYEMDRDSSICLVAGYDANARMRIIKRWQELESKNAQELSPAEFLLQQAHLLVAVERKQKQLEAEQKQQNLRLESVEARIDSSTGYTTVKAFCKMHNIHCPLRLAKVYGKDLSAMCREQKLPLGRVSDEVFGSVNSYPISLMEEYFELNQ